MTYGKDAIEWRRGKVLELSSQGYNQQEIPPDCKLQKEASTVIYLSLKSSL